MKKISLALIPLLIAVLVFSGCSKVEETETGSAYPFEIIKSTERINAEIQLENGKSIKLELYPDIAPVTVSNFVYLANEKFYDGLIFHRVIEGFMIQGGCPNGIGNGGPGYNILGEFTANGVNNNIKHERGVISMARSQDFNSAGSQFFICHKNDNVSHLDGQYAAFGRVTDGLEVVDEIATAKTGANDKSVEDIVIKTIIIESK